VFRLKPVSQDNPPPAGKVSPGQVGWNYDRAELVLDGIVHAVGIMLGLTGAVALVIMAARSWPVTIAPTVIYVVALVAMLGTSAAYNMWPVSPTKWLLRRFDHSAIYLLIAGTYTPVTLVSLRGPWGWTLCGLVWGLALLGITLKVVAMGRFRGLSLALYLSMGWLVVIALRPLTAALAYDGMVLLVLGGLAYTLGVLFYVWRRLPYHHAVWHAFVLAGSVLHFLAIFLYVVPGRS